MAQNRIIYDIDGKVKETSGSYYDDASGQIVFNNLTFNTMSIQLNDGLLYANNKNLSSSLPNNKQFILWDTATNKWAIKDAPNNIASQAFIAGSDLSGAVSGALVRSLSNARTGTLSALYGGTGLSTSSYSNGESLLVYNGGSSYTLLNVNNAQEGSVVASTTSSWVVQTSSVGTYVSDIDVAVYTIPGVYTWSKPLGTKYIRLIVQGAGGGGAAGANRNTLLSATGGGGGSSGGLIDNSITIDDSYNNITVIVGSGGLGGYVQSVNNNGTAGFNGGSSSFGNLAYAYGGLGGNGGLYNGSTSTGGTNTVDGTFSSRDFLLYGVNNVTFTSDAGNSGRSDSNGSSQSNVVSSDALTIAPGGAGAGGLLSGSNTAYDGGVGGSGITNNGTAASKNGKIAVTYPLTGALGITSSDFTTGSGIFVASGGGGGAGNTTGIGGMGGWGLYGSGGGGAGASTSAVPPPIAIYNLTESSLSNVRDGGIYPTLFQKGASAITQFIVAPAGLYTGTHYAMSSSYNADATGVYHTSRITNFPSYTTSSNFTYECWAYFGNVGNAGVAISRSVVFHTNNNFALVVGGPAAGGATGYYTIWNSSVDTQTTLTFTPNQWVHLAMVRNGSNLKIYANGTGSANVAITNASLTDTGTIYVGTNGDSNRNINGLIAGFRGLPYALTDAEIISLWQNKTPRVNTFTSYQYPAGSNYPYVSGSGGNGGDGYVAVISYKF